MSLVQPFGVPRRICEKQKQNKTNNRGIVFIFISSGRTEDNDLRWPRLRQISDPVEPATEKEKEIKEAVKIVRTIVHQDLLLQDTIE